MLRMSLVDSAQWLSKTQDLVDGVRIEIVIKGLGSGAGVKTKSYPFRYHTSTDQNSASGIVYDIDAYWDNPVYWIRSTTTPIKGTSNKALSIIANNCKLKYEGLNTSDSQIWLPGNKKYWKFAQDVCAHGQANDRSCMQMALTANNVLRYRDVMAVPDKPVGRFLTGKHKKDFYTVTDHRLKDRSGLYNNLTGYAQSTYEPSVAGDTKTHTKVQVKKTTPRLAMNNEIHSKIDVAATEVRPVNSGNVHAGYEQAAYRNLRLANLFSVGVELVVNEQTDVDLLDYVYFEEDQPANDKASRPWSGLYLVSTKVIYVEGLNYYEKFDILRTGLNNNSASQV
jgi:hypothetical protein